DLLNPGGAAVLADLLRSVADPALDPAFLRSAADATLTTVVFALLGTAGTLVLGLAGGLALSDAAWSDTPRGAVRAARAPLRVLLVGIRSVHEVVWALLLVTVLGLDPLVAVLAIALPFGAQTAKVVADVLDDVPAGSRDQLRSAGASAVTALCYGTLPIAAPLLVSYAVYRFECAVRSTVLLGVVGVGGLGGELVVSLRSRNWDEVWTLVGVVVLLSALVEWWGSRSRARLAVASCSDWGVQRAATPTSSTRGRAWLVLAGVAVPVAWLASGASLGSLTSPRTHAAASGLLAELWPPAFPPAGPAAVASATLDTAAMAVLATAVAVVFTLILAPFSVRTRKVRGEAGHASPLRWAARAASRATLLVLRSVPPTVWAALALIVVLPGILPGVVALGLYTGGVLGRLVAEAWDGMDLRARDALRYAGATPSASAVVAVLPPSGRHLVSYTLYRFEICLRDTAVVGVVGAAGLGRLLAENLAVFRMPAVGTLLAASFALSVGAEAVGRAVRRSVRTGA
ncbi:MAG: PhnE/PtxC family ABC transporter permease, partial [Phycicoccus sp.]